MRRARLFLVLALAAGAGLPVLPASGVPPAKKKKVRGKEAKGAEPKVDPSKAGEAKGGGPASPESRPAEPHAPPAVTPDAKGPPAVPEVKGAEPKGAEVRPAPAADPRALPEAKPAGEPRAGSGPDPAARTAAPASPAPPSVEALRVEAAKKKLAAEGRKRSALTPGDASRWSNRGAMSPIVSEVPLSAPLPTRAMPIASGQETPGQNLIGEEELLHARFYLSGYHLATKGQDVTYIDTLDPKGVMVDPQGTRDINLYRLRAAMAYEHIAGSDLGAHLDLEYRARSTGSRPTDHRVNELYLSYGLTDFRQRGGMDWGVALGRVAIREAGYAQADGLAFRLRLTPELRLGAFGGVTGNPYGYNWLEHKTQEFSAAWIRGGAFASYRDRSLVANVAGVATVARIDPMNQGLDRIYLFLDVAYLALEDLNLFLSGWVDVVGGQPVQSIEAAAAYHPTRELELRLGVGRFSTLSYDVSTAYSYGVDPLGNKAVIDPIRGTQGVIVDEDGQPIIPYDAARQTSVYNFARLRAGYRPLRTVEVFGTLDSFLRERGAAEAELRAAGIETALDVAPLRLQPGVGAALRDPDLFDAGASFSYIMDQQSQAKAFAQASLGRGYEGLYAGVDGRLYFGDTSALDVGGDLSYVLPGEWFPGRVLLRGSVRFFRERLSLSRIDDPTIDIFNANTPLPGVITKQDSLLGLLSLEWRL